jgi:hypothetical protein
MSARDLPPDLTTQRSAEHHEKLHRPVIAVSLRLTVARGSQRSLQEKWQVIENRGN